MLHSYVCCFYLISSISQSTLLVVSQTCAGSATLALLWSHVADPSKSLGWCHHWVAGGKCGGVTKWFCPTDAAVWLQQSSQGLDGT